MSGSAAFGPVGRGRPRNKRCGLTLGSGPVDEPVEPGVQDARHVLGVFQGAAGDDSGEDLLRVDAAGLGLGEAV